MTDVYLLAVTMAFGTLNWAPTISRDVQVRHIDVQRVADLFREMKSNWGQVGVNARKRTIRITDLPWEVDRMTNIVGAVDQPDAVEARWVERSQGIRIAVDRLQKIYVATVKFGLASDVAAKLNELFGEEWSRALSLSRYRPERIWAVVPDDRQNRLIVVADERGYVRVRRLLTGCPEPRSRESVTVPLTPGLETTSIPVKNRDIREVANLLGMVKGQWGRFIVDASQREARVTDIPGRSDRIARIVRAIDESDLPDQHIWIFREPVDPTDLAQLFTHMLIELAPKSGATLSKIIAADREKLLIVVGDRAGYATVKNAFAHIHDYGLYADTIPINVRNRDVGDVAELLGSLKSPSGQVKLNCDRRTFLVKDNIENMQRMDRIARAVDEPTAPDQRLWVIPMQRKTADEAEHVFRTLFAAPSEAVSKIVPDDDGKQLIIVASERGFMRVVQTHVNGCPETKTSD